MRSLIHRLEESLGWMCTCVFGKCFKKSRRYHCGVKTRGCFRQMQ